MKKIHRKSVSLLFVGTWSQRMRTDGVWQLLKHMVKVLLKKHVTPLVRLFYAENAAGIFSTFPPPPRLFKTDLFVSDHYFDFWNGNFPLYGIFSLLCCCHRWAWWWCYTSVCIFFLCPDFLSWFDFVYHEENSMKPKEDMKVF